MSALMVRSNRRETGAAGYRKQSGGRHVTALPTAVRVPLSADAFRQAGNRNAATLISRFNSGPASGSGDASIIGLRSRDGLDWGTWDRRPRVETLQKTLNTKTTSALGVDGMWGSKTSEALHAFQTSAGLPLTEIVDSTTGRHLQSGPGAALDEQPAEAEAETESTEQQPPAPQTQGAQSGQQFIGGAGLPDPTILNPTLERILDEIMLEYSRLLIAQGDAVGQVERDLRGQTEDADDNIFVVALKRAASEVLNLVLGGGPQSLRTVAVAASGIGGLLKQGAIDLPFDAAKEGAQSAIHGELASGGGNQPLSQFISAQHRAINQAHLQSQMTFVRPANGGASAKEHLRRFQPGDELAILVNPLADPRESRAVKVLEGVQQATAEAPRKQYRETTRQWALANAQSTLGVTGSNPETLHTHVFGLREHTDVHEVPGILELGFNFDPDSPKLPAILTEASIAGLSPVVRQKIAASGATVGDLGYPARAMGSTAFLGILEIFNLGTNVSVARDESATDFEEINSDDEGQDYLTKKGDGNFFAGTKTLFEELDRTNLLQVGGLKGP